MNRVIAIVRLGLALCPPAVVPSQRMVTPEVMAAYRRSNEKYRELYKRLAQA